MDKVIIKQDGQFLYYSDGSKDSIAEYRQKMKLPPRKTKDEIYKKYRDENKDWLKKKAEGKLKNLDDIK